MKQCRKTLGIVGGLSPEVTAQFYERIVAAAREKGHEYPHIMIDSVPLPFRIEEAAIVYGKNAPLFPYLSSSVQRLQGADCIVIPCNTAHIFIEQLRERSNAPILGISETVISHAERTGCRTLGILATTATAQSSVYSSGTVAFRYPCPGDQRELSGIILRQVRNCPAAGDASAAERIAQRLGKTCDAVVLACTDLQRILKGNYIDSFAVLAAAAFEEIGGDEL